MSARSIVYVELSARDPEGTARFYSRLFGWEFERDPEQDYWMFRAGEGPGGGLSKVSGTDNDLNIKPGDVVVYVDSEDIASDLRNAEELGGKVLVPKTEIPGMGWFAVFADPTGNKVGLFTSQM
jgi:predicted enzyme related to lactoylglutathione lyase